jgi:thiol:disulfide interchange protein DsbC
MKRLTGFAALFLCMFLAVPALAQEPAKAPSQDAATERVKAELKKKIPEATVDVIRKVPYGGLYEVVVGNEIFYTDEKASYLLLGSIVDTRTRENVTELRMRQLNRVAFDSLPLDNAIKIVRGNGARRVAIFADPNCGYCKRFERDLLGVSDITVYLFLYPILAPDSVSKSKAVWCAPDRGKAWLDFMARDLALPAETGCATPIDKLLEYGKTKRITGTPTIFFEDGERIPGAMSIVEFEKRLAAAKAPAKVSSN